MPQSQCYLALVAIGGGNAALEWLQDNLFGLLEFSPFEMLGFSFESTNVLPFVISARVRLRAFTTLAGTGRLVSVCLPPYEGVLPPSAASPCALTSDTPTSRRTGDTSVSPIRRGAQLDGDIIYNPHNSSRNPCVRRRRRTR